MNSSKNKAITKGIKSWLRRLNAYSSKCLIRVRGQEIHTSLEESSSVYQDSK